MRAHAPNAHGGYRCAEKCKREDGAKVAEKVFLYNRQVYTCPEYR